MLFLQEKDDGTPGDLLIKQVRVDQPTIQATDDYAGRISTDEKSNLLISLASLEDQRTFTCMVVSDTNLQEFPVTVVVYSKLILYCIKPVQQTTRFPTSVSLSFFNCLIVSDRW